MQYMQVNGDRIVGISDWDGKGNPPQDGLRKAPDGITSEWIGKSYDAAVLAGSQSKNGKIISAKDAPEGKRPEEATPPSGLHASGEALNANMGDATMAMEHPLDSELGSEMRTPQPELHVAIVPATQPKTAAPAERKAKASVK